MRSARVMACAALAACLAASSIVAAPVAAAAARPASAPAVVAPVVVSVLVYNCPAAIQSASSIPAPAGPNTGCNAIDSTLNPSPVVGSTTWKDYGGRFPFDVIVDDGTASQTIADASPQGGGTCGPDGCFVRSLPYWYQVPSDSDVHLGLFDVPTGFRVGVIKVLDTTTRATVPSEVWPYSHDGMIDLTGHSGGVEVRIFNFVGPVSRLAGADRYSTAAAIATATYPGGAPAVYVATGANYADALTGAAAAGWEGAPLLLVPGTSIPASVSAALTKLHPSVITILGSKAAVTGSVQTQLAAFVGNNATRVHRIEGADRYATAAAIAAHTFSGGADVVYVATGLGFPDAMAGAAAAGGTGGPVLLVPGTSIPSSVSSVLANTLKPKLIYVLGSKAVVSDGVKASLAAFVGNNPAKVIRLSGTDRYGTAAVIATNAYSQGVSLVYVATGLNYPDALAGAAAAAWSGAPILLVPPTSVPQAVKDALSTKLRPENIVILGGPAVVSAAVQTQLANYVYP